MQPAITTYPLLHLASGDRLQVQMFTFHGQEPGKTAYIQANLHGSEIVGNAVIHQLITWLSGLDANQLRGYVQLVPMCNPLSINQRSHHFPSGRFSPYDGKDWNRIFWDYEAVADVMAFAQNHLGQSEREIQSAYRQAICQQFEQDHELRHTAAGMKASDRIRYRLQSLCRDADYVLDLHSSTNQGVNYVYYFRNRQDSAPAFLMDAVLLDKYDGDAFDEAFIKPWLALEHCFEELGQPLRFEVEAWTLELGSGMAISADSLELGVTGIQNYLRHKGIVLDAPPLTANPQNRFCDRSQMQKYYAPLGGLIQFHHALNSYIKPGQILYELLTFNKVGELPLVQPVIATKSGWIFDYATHQAVNEGDYVLTLMTDH
jgi:predicted deacylase